MTIPNVDSHVLRLSGKAEMPHGIEMGHNWRVSCEGSIKNIADSDNEDGTVTRVYTFKPVKTEVLTPLGETIKLKDTRSNSQLFRSLLYKKWVNAASDESFDDFYDGVMQILMFKVDYVIDWYEKK